MVANVAGARQNGGGRHLKGQNACVGEDGASVVQTFFCCLLGFEEPAARTLRGLARLFRPSLTAEWEFTDAWQENCVLLLCNLDDANTRDLWLQGSLTDMPLAFATSAVELPSGLALRKPLRGQGPNGLVHVLNQVAEAQLSGHAAGALQPDPPATPSDPSRLPETSRATVVPFPTPAGGTPGIALGQTWSPGGGRNEGALVASGGHANQATAKTLPHADPTESLAPQVRTGDALPGLAETQPHTQPVAAPESHAGEVEPILLDASLRIDGGTTADEPPTGVGPTGEAPTEKLPTVDADAHPAQAEDVAESVSDASVEPPPPLAVEPVVDALEADAPDPEPTEPPPDDVSVGAGIADKALDPGAIAFPPAGDQPEEGMRVTVVPVADTPSNYGSAKVVTARADTHRVDEESALRSILRGLHAEPAPAEMEQDDFLALINRLHWLRSVGVVNFEGIAPLCIVPTEGLFFGRVTLGEIAERLRDNRYPAASQHEARELIDGLGIAPGQLKDLFWVANIRCVNAEQVSRFETGAYRLRRWPDLTQLPHERHHVTWCGILARRPVTLAALSAVTSAAEQELAAFLAACAALSILEAVEVTAEAENSATAVPSARSRERNSIFRSLLNRLGFSRS